MIGLSTKRQECMVLNTGGSFPDFVSNVIIADDMIHTHKEAKNRKIVAASSGSAPPRYRTVYHHGHLSASSAAAAPASVAAVGFLPTSTLAGRT
jgi:hypothetical protein